jgi:hypothetical protein
MWYQKDLQTLEIGHCARWRIHPRIVSQAENAGSIPVARSNPIPSAHTGFALDSCTRSSPKSAGVHHACTYSPRPLRP